MALIKVNGIVIRHANYRESDRILTLLTAERGLVSAGARGCRRQKSPLLPASELFVYGEYVLFQNLDKYTVDSCDIHESFYPLREDYRKLSAAECMLAVTNECATSDEPGERMVSLLLYALTYMAYGEDCNSADIALCFILKLLRLIGYSPVITNCAICGKDLRNGGGNIVFSSPAGGAICEECGFGMPISRLSLEAMRRMLMLPDSEINKAKLPEKVRDELKAALGEYVEQVFGKRFKPFAML